MSVTETEAPAADTTTSPPPITMTEVSAKKVAALRAQEEAPETLALRVAVRPGGCSGFSYEMFFDTEITDEDRQDEFFGERIVVDPQSAKLLEGASLEFKDGLQGAGFSINNPNASRSCGCGQSFS